MATTPSEPGTIRDRARRAAAAIGAVLAMSSTLTGEGRAQGVARATLPPPDGVAADRFTEIAFARELADGRLLIADRAERRLAVVDFGTGGTTTIGRSGAGPGEYNLIGGLFALRGDSSLFIDLPSGRPHLLQGDRIVTTLGARALPWVEFVTGGDTLAHIIGIRGVTASGRIVSTGSADTLLLLRIDRVSERVDTIARLKGRAGIGRRVDRPVGNRPGLIITNNPLVSEEQAALFPDGWIAVARLEPYRVDWRTPHGPWIHGPPLPFVRIRVDEREKCTALMRFGGDREGGTAERCKASFLSGWPEILPAFLPAWYANTLLAAPDGRLLVLRTPTVSSPDRHYDIIDRQGRLAARLTLPANELLVGFGARSVYVTATDDLGLQTLRRHPWPIAPQRD